MTPSFNPAVIQAARLELVNLRAHVDAALASLEPLLLGAGDQFVAELVAEPLLAPMMACACSTAPATAKAATKPRKPKDINAASAAMAALDAQIVAIVRDTQPAKPQAVAAAIDGKTSIIRARIQLLVKAGRLVAEGATLKRVLRLPAPDAKAQAVKVEDRLAPSGVEAPEVTADRDAAILTLVKRGPKTFDDLLRGLTTKPAEVSADAFRVLVKRSLRRLIMRGQLVDVGDKFKAA